MEGKMNFLFDEEDDVLEITIGKPKKAAAKELKNDIAVRVDPETSRFETFSFEQARKPIVKGQIVLKQ